MRTASVLAAVASGVLCATCNYGEVVVVEPAAVGHGPLTLSFQPEAEDTAVARELGWGAAIPGADVTVSPGNADTATGPAVAVLQTDGAGKASVPDLPDGQYLVEVRRVLTPAEIAGLASREDVVGFMSEAVVGRGTVTLPVPASRRHSIVISEWGFQPLWAGVGVGWYYYGGFLELVNNADTTVYLDGLVIGQAFTVDADYGQNRCVVYSEWTNDPDGIWTRYMDSLPGTGHDYPLAPGAVAMIATDAIDHSGIVSGGLDLRTASFEFVGSADPDNPTVPNTISIGPDTYWGGHGLYLNASLDAIVFVALPVDVASLPRTTMPQIPGTVYVRVPRARILDVVDLLSTYPFPYTLCPQLVHRNFDRYRGRFGPVGGRDYTIYSEEGLYSVQRKVAYTRADGRKILQHTRTTNADFFYGLRTPFRLP